MLLRKTILVSLPILVFAACKDDKKKNQTPENSTIVAEALTQNNASTESKNGTTASTDSKSGSDTSSNQSQNQSQNNGGTTTTHECETQVIDFEKGSNGSTLHFGEEANAQYSSWGVGFIAHKTLSNGNTIYDVKPVLVDTPKTGLGATTDLSDNQNGGYVKLTFAKPTSIISLDLIDIDNNSSNIELFTVNDKNEYVSKSVQAIPQHGDKETFNLSVDDHSYIRKMTIKLSGSSAVDNIKICIKN